MKNVYVLLTRAQTATSALIHLATGDLYTHVSLAYDDSLESLCSFARLYYPLPFPGGLIREEIRKGHFSHFKNVHCVLLSLPVTDEVHRNIKNCVQAMVRDRGNYRYSYLGAAFCRAGIAQPGAAPSAIFARSLSRKSCCSRALFLCRSFRA